MDELSMQDQIRWPVVFSAGTRIEFAPTQQMGPAYFGGPLEQKFVGQDFGPEPLHRIFTVSAGALPQPDGHCLQGRLAVFFGLRYDGCELQYEMPAARTAAISITRIAPAASTPDWPYEDYPRLLPYVQLEEVSRAPINVREFADRYIWQGMDEATDEDLIVVVPAIATLGVSLWGRVGDDEGVQIVCRYSYATRQATVTTRCT